jgi:hypothetical protein
MLLLKIIVFPVLAALVVTVVLFLLRKKPVAPWFWVPVTVWSAWWGLSLLPLVLPRDPFYGPAEWSMFGYDALLVIVCLAFAGTLFAGCLVCFPRKKERRVKSWAGGCMIAIVLPLVSWLLLTNPYSFQLIDPDGNPVAGATIYRLTPGLGSRLASVTAKTSDAEGVVAYRISRWTKLALLVPGGDSRATTEISIHSPTGEYGTINPINFARECHLSWGNHIGTGFDQAFSREFPASWKLSDRGVWRYPNPEVRGRAGWVIPEGMNKVPIPIFLHSRDHPIHAGLLDLLRAQLKDEILVARFPSFVREIACDGYGILLGQELRDIHNQVGKSDIHLESDIRQSLFTQADVLADWKKKIDRIERAKEAARVDAIEDLRPWIGWSRVSPISLDLEQELPSVSQKVNDEARVLLDHIRNHPRTTERSLMDFESRLTAPGKE